MKTIDGLPVDAEQNDNLRKTEADDGFYNVIDGEKVSSSKRLSVVNPATGQPAALPDVHRASLNKAISNAKNAF
jgi:hypothetical protein